jgi:hypothetical protein
VSNNNQNLIDTYSLKGFVSIGAFADNDRFETAPLGELSLQSATYAKDRLLYTVSSGGSNATALELAVFSTRTPDDDHFPVPAPYEAFLKDVITWCHAQALIGTFTNNAEDCRQAFMAEYDGVTIDGVAGQMIQQAGVWLPSSLTFYIDPDGLNVTWNPQLRLQLERSRIKLWFADSAFSTEYDEFEIEFLAPLANNRLDDFFLLAEQVQTRVQTRTLEQTMNLVHGIKNGKPETKIRTISFLYHDPLSTTWTLPTNWTFIIYGIAGDNIDSIKAKLSEWILDNSTRTREQWARIFPDIFSSTEFIVTPMWNLLSVPNQTLQEGVYSPTVNLQLAMSTARRTCIGTRYTQQHIDSVIASVSCPYKSVALLIAGGPENRDGFDRFEELWPDYMSVFTSSLDFNRMGPMTQQWVTLLHAMLRTAETMTDFSDLPQTPYSMTRLKRTNAQGDTVMYVVANFNNIQYLVASRQSIQQLFPPRNADDLRVTTEGADGVVAMPNANITDGTYTTFFAGVGGTEPYRFELVSVSDPTRLSNAVIDPDTGVFTGIPLIAGDIQVTIRIIDNNDIVAVKVFTLHIFTGNGA